ncbi:hypothetical protein T10_13282 [Trichinella papuae]|uniref:Uncharacterized protein n=1 Tax=Trichinella papuae TaxID=268474 RepID=A0A0V1MA93_9BILA|nr:hypothetical protein T10_13282 [Trichinella papuae]
MNLSICHYFYSSVITSAKEHCLTKFFLDRDDNNIEIEQILQRCSPRTGPTRKAALSNSGLCASQPTK